MRARRAVFLDRDGTINVEVGYLSSPEDFVLIEGSGHAIKKLNERGFLVLVVSNQSGVARGYFDEGTVKKINERMIDELSRYGARLDGVYYCPHHPEGKVEEYRRECDCRKPGPGMVRQAREEFEIDIENSYVVGDHRGDILLARNIGARSILVVTGHGTEEEQKLRAEGIRPERVVENLAQAVDAILMDDSRGGTSMAIDKDLLDILACPQCKGDLDLTKTGDGLVCKKCKLMYEIKDDIPIMLIDEAKKLD